jgi:hypothetical protein
MASTLKGTCSSTAAELAVESPLLAGLTAASIAGRMAIGVEAAGSRSVHLGRTAEAVPDDGSGEPCHTHRRLRPARGGRRTWRRPGALEHLCRYVLRPPIAQDSFSTARTVACASRFGGRGATVRAHCCSIRSTFSARLAALTPKPRVNRYHGVLAPHAARRRAAVVR